MEAFRAYRIHEEDGKASGRLETIGLDDLSDGEVVVRVEWSDVNYKDALAATGKGRILRRYPLVGGIDLAGVVHESSDSRFSPGDPVAVIGCGLSEDHDGGYAEYARVKADWVLSLPEGLDSRTAMGLGTAGFTAAIAVDHMERMGQTPALGPVLVNGATGGVGSFAIDMLAGRGYEVVALTGKADAGDYLTGLGAARILVRSEVEMGTRPLERSQWGGAVDNVGGGELGWLTRTVEPGGNIASIGLAGGIKLETTVMPFILRGINLLGINSVLMPMDEKQRIFARTGADLRPRNLDSIVTRAVTLDELPGVFDAYIEGGVQGRTVVQLTAD